MPLSRRAAEIAAILVALAILVAMALRLAGAHGLVLADGQPLFGDFIAYWSAGRAALDGHAATVHDWDTARVYHQLAAPGVAVVAPWHSPPMFLLIAAALALLPYPAAALVFLIGSGTLYFFAARKLLPDARALIFAATLPAALFHLGTVQSGLLIAGASGLALTWLDKRPLASGALVALLAVKPHLAVLWPLMLALAGRWRAFMAASLGVVLFSVTAGAVFGFESLVRFVENLPVAQDLVVSQLVSTPAYASLYGNLVDAGLPRSWALAAEQPAERALDTRWAGKALPPEHGAPATSLPPGTRPESDASRDLFADATRRPAACDHDRQDRDHCPRLGLREPIWLLDDV
jgi:hypothetical protein